MKIEDLEIGKTYVATLAGRSVDTVIKDIDYVGRVVFTDFGPLTFSVVETCLHEKSPPDGTSRASHVS